MSFRKEKKFRLSKFEFDTLKYDLCIKGMETLHEKRPVNSLYYDTEHYLMFNDSEEGLLPRKKVRVRWYENIRMAKREVKISSMEGRFKTSTPVSVVSENSPFQNLYDLQYGAITPALHVSYTREYFLFEHMRLTFDSNIQYANYRQSQSVLHNDGEVVMEVKVGLEIPEDYIECMLPFATSRFSKYSRGLLLSNGGI